MCKALLISHRLLDAVLAEAKRCGSNFRECVTYLTASLEAPRVVDGYLHPQHHASSVMTEVSAEELGNVWDDLLATRRTIVCQVHTHPGAAFHSDTDDRYPVVHSVGFLSLVIPDFGYRGVRDVHLAVYLGEGRWEAATPRENYLVISDD